MSLKSFRRLREPRDNVAAVPELALPIDGFTRHQTATQKVGINCLPTFSTSGSK